LAVIGGIGVVGIYFLINYWIGLAVSKKGEKK